jgi:hypothetical protein
MTLNINYPGVRPEVENHENWFERVGGVFTFDQQRTGMGKTIRRDIWEIMRGNGIEGGMKRDILPIRSKFY